MSDLHTATARVATTAAPRYAKHLASHLGRRGRVEDVDGDIRIAITVGQCLLRSTPEALELTASATTGDQLRTVTHVIGSHLERFGQRHELAVHWRYADAEPDGAPPAA